MVRNKSELEMGARGKDGLKDEVGMARFRRIFFANIGRSLCALITLFGKSVEHS